MSQEVPASPIFSLQIDPSPDLTTLVENPIMMMFDVVHICIIYNHVIYELYICMCYVSQQTDIQDNEDFTVDDVSCNFYNFMLVTNHNL